MFNGRCSFGGYKFFGGIHLRDRVNIVVFIFTGISEPYFLLLRRSQDRGGFWQPVSGGIEGNEDSMQAVKREIFEETGIKSDIRLIDLELSYEYEAIKNNVSMKMRDICFGAEIPDVTSVNLSNEHAAYRWYKKEEVYTYLNWKNIRFAFEKLIHLIEGR